MPLSIGIVGLPNVGKSTLFNALSGASVLAANYPFATKDPNVGVVPVPDDRLEKLAVLYKPKKTTHAALQFLDIAGLVRGASKGEGLGNQFLANIRECDAVVQVVRCFDDDNIVHVEGSVNPIRDIETIQIELALADLASAEKRKDKATRAEKSGVDKLIKAAYHMLGLMSFLTAGEKEVRAWTIPIGTKAPQAGGEIHTDIERGFIRAEIISYDDLVVCGSRKAASEKGLARLEGKEYIMQDGDVVDFRFNV